MLTENYINRKKNMLELTYLNEKLKFHNFWLRDHCQCEDCYISKTLQRKARVLNVPLDIEIESCNITKNEIDIEWSDNHKSTYKIENLIKSSFNYYKQQLENNQNLIVHWDAESIQKEDYARVDCDDYMKNDNISKKVVESLIKYGVAFIENVPPTIEDTRIITKKLFPIQRNIFGELEAMEGNFEHNDVAYSKNYLERHTDNMYFNDPAGLVVQHCLVHNGSGAVTFILDSFKAAKDFRAKNPKGFKHLSTLPVSNDYIEEGEYHHYCTPVIQTNIITGHVENVRFNVNDRAAMNSLSDDQIMDFYEAYHGFCKEMFDEKNEWHFKLNPGTVMIVDNWRLVHGRSEFTGFRSFASGYVSRTDFLSKARVLGIIS